jgi:RNA polymerase sigma factor (sigma-70 family)
VPKVLFQHNVESQILRRHAEHDRGFLRRSYMRLQYRRTRDLEARYGREFNKVIAVSRQDQETFEREYGWTNVRAIDTAVDLDYFSPTGEEERPDRVVEQSEFSELLKSKLELFAQKLEGREQTIFRERWLTENPKTLQEIGDAYGVSRERARQLEKRLLGRLRKYLEAELGQTVDIDSLSRD